MKTLILGIGNPLLGDDGVGFHVAQELAKETIDENIDIKVASADSLNLLELIVGYDKVIVIDAIMALDGEIGEIYKLRPENLTNTVQVATSVHHANLATTLEIGIKILAEQMPGEIVVFAVEIEEVTKFTEEMTKKVKEAVPKVVNLILEEVAPRNGPFVTEAFREMGAGK